MTKPTKGKYNPIDPVALSTTFKAPRTSGHEQPILSAIRGDNSDLMEQVAALWICEGDTVVDATFGRGVFLRKTEGLPTHKHDLKLDGVDCRRLPYFPSSVDVVVIDPPYRPSQGSQPDTFKEDRFAQCYQLGTEKLDTMNDVIELYRGAIKEAARVLKPGGRIMVKCQDMSYCHRLHLVSLDVLRLIVESGFEFADQFVLLNTGRPTSSQWNKQERARRAHSILWVGARSGQ